MKLKTIIKISFAFLVGFLVISKQGIGLKCYSCFSQVSWDQCHNGNRSLTIETCRAEANEKHCLTEYMKMKNGEHRYEKYCARWDHCNTTACFYSPSVEHCERTCCQNNLCNGAQKLTFSGFLLPSCVTFVLGALL